MPLTVLLACGAGEPELLTRRSASAPELAAATEVTARTPALQRGRFIGGEKVARAIAWPADATLAKAAHARYDADARAAIARAPLPVLAPPEPLERTTVTVGAHWYALTGYGKGFSVHIDGSAQARVYPHIKAFERTHPMRESDGFLTRNEGIWSATWIEHGVAYSFEIECDARVVAWCDDEAAVLARLEALVYVGGEQVRR